MNNVKKILLVLGLSTSCIVILYLFSTRNTKAKNGFNRNFSGEEIIIKNSKALDEGYYQIIDINSSYVTVCKYKMPHYQLKFSIDLERQYKYKLPLLNGEIFDGLTNVTLLDSSILIINGITSTAYNLVLKPQSLKKRILDTVPFYQSEVINSNSYVVRSNAQLNGCNRRKLKKINWEGIESASYLPEMQSDGYFCTDGMFGYDKDTQHLIYMFFYRGSFTCLDTNLQVIYNAKTIDTVKYAKILLKTVKNRTTHVVPPHLVNKRFCIAKDRIYVHSALKADNEKSKDFDKSDVIDVYDISNGVYIVSFYLPKVERQKLTEFKIDRNNLVALYSNKLAVFKMPVLE